MKTKKQLVSILLACSVLIGVFTLVGTEVRANNLDTEFKFENRALGYIYFTAPRQKDNASAVYVYYQSAINQPHGTFFSAWSGGINYTDNDSGIIRVGQQRKISQRIYENGKRTCNLAISPRNFNATLVQGLWSPDTVGDYPYCNWP